MATILKGAPVVAAMNERNAALCEQLKTKGITPTLAVVRVGEREDDLSYERGVIARCGKVGVEVKQFLLPADASQDELLKVIAEVNAEDAIHGCLLFRPLPKQFDDRTVRAALAPEKDIDGITDGSLAGVFTNTDLGYAPCTAQACLEILKYYNIPLSGRRAVVVGRSLVVGKPAAMMPKINKGESMRVFPISNWTEKDIWQYIKREKIDIVPLYFAAKRPVVERDGNLIMVDDDRLPLKEGEVPEYKSVRFRTLGCYPLTGGIESTADTLDEIIEETLSAVSSERTSRVIDNEAAGSMERRKREGYF